MPGAERNNKQAVSFNFGASNAVTAAGATNTLFAQITAQADQPRVFQFAGFFRF